MISKMTGGFILILAAAYLTLVTAEDLQELNLTANTDNHDDLQEPVDSDTLRDGTIVGFTIVPIFSIVVIIIACCFCAACPLYKIRHKGTVYASTTTHQPAVVVYQEPPYSVQPINPQILQQPPYPGFIYSPGHTLPQTSNPPYYSAGTEQQRNPGFGHYAGAPDAPPPYYQTSPQNQNMNINYRSK